MADLISMNQFKEKDKDTFTIELDTYIEASPETIYSVLTDKEGLKDIMGCDIEGEIKVGSPIKFIWQMEEGSDCTGINGGEVISLIPNKLFSFTWGDPDENRDLDWGSTLVEFIIEEEGSGSRVRFHHYKLPSDYEAGQHMGGWRRFLEITRDKFVP